MSVRPGILRVLMWLGIAGSSIYGLGLAGMPHCNCRQQPRGIEAGVRSLLRILGQAQQDFMAECRLDRDGDGRGEAGTLAQLATAMPVCTPVGKTDAPRKVGRPLLFPFVAAAQVEHGRLHRGLYFLQVYLPTADGRWVTEGEAGIDASEERYRVCAWPDGRSSLTLRAFWMDGDGEVWSCLNEDRRYCGANQPLGPTEGEPSSPVSGADPEHRDARDGHVWSWSH